MLTVERRNPLDGRRAAATGCTRSPAVPREVVIAGRRLHPTEVFATYWSFATQRQQIYQARLRGEPGPWTSDPILRQHRFTNCYRASDRVSQYLISNVIYNGPQDFDEVVFRTLLFKIFNKVETWELLLGELCEIPSWRSFSFAEYDQILGRAFAAGQRLYSAAYVMAPPKFGAVRKHSNHLRLLHQIMATDVPATLQACASMQNAFEVLRAQPGLGNFLAFQYLVDLNYSNGLRFDEMEFVVAGPGAKDGVRKCFGPDAAGIEADVIAHMAHMQDEYFATFGLNFERLRGRPLQLIDCQNLFCEVDKYARVAHPRISGISGRTRIKQRFTPALPELTSWFPPKWGINPEH